MSINPMQVLQMLTRFKSNPMSMLAQFGVPQSISNNPQAVIQNMMNRGVISQDMYNQAMQMARDFGAKV